MTAIQKIGGDKERDNVLPSSPIRQMLAELSKVWLNFNSLGADFKDKRRALNHFLSIFAFSAQMLGGRQVARISCSVPLNMAQVMEIKAIFLGMITSLL